MVCKINEFSTQINYPLVCYRRAEFFFLTILSLISKSLHFVVFCVYVSYLEIYPLQINFATYNQTHVNSRFLKTEYFVPEH